MPITNAIEIIKPIVEIAILWVVFYRILLFFQGTRAFQVLRGIAYLIIALLLSQILGLKVLNWLLSHFFSIWIVMVVVIFQHELRSGLARLGQQHIFSISMGETELNALIEEITEAVYKLARRKAGCLIAIERQMKLPMYIESGVPLDAKISAPLLESIFLTTSPLHDGGVVICGERIAASSCLFPLSDNPSVNKTVGTRHRAALGLSEHTDAVIALVSEETSDVSVVYEGRFIKIDHEKHLSSLLKELLNPPSKAKV
jgi:diadenylate cyclase